MSVTYAVEPWSAVWREMQPHWQHHWIEVALDHEQVPLDPDIVAYNDLEAKGMLQVLVARNFGAVIGYHLSILRPHLHYRRSLHAFTDIYYVVPAFRQGMTGVRLFKEAEKALAARGVKKMISGTKLQKSNVTGKSLDMSAILQRLGWRETEHTYTKTIEA